MRRGWLWFWAVLGLLNGVLCLGLFVWSALDDNWGRAAVNLICALVSLGWGSYFLAHAQEARR